MITQYVMPFVFVIVVEWVLSHPGMHGGIFSPGLSGPERMMGVLGAGLAYCIGVIMFGFIDAEERRNHP
jgi:hypothetical protein